MVFNLPKCILAFVRLVNSDMWHVCKPGTQSIQDVPQNDWEAAERVVNVLNITNSATNFAMYCLFGEKFRKECIRILCCCRKVKFSLPVQGVVSLQVPTVNVSDSARQGTSWGTSTTTTGSPPNIMKSRSPTITRKF